MKKETLPTKRAGDKQDTFLSKEAINHAERLIALKWTKETDINVIAGTWQAGYTFGQLDAEKKKIQR